MPKFWDRVRDTARAVVRAVRDPRSFAPPPLPTRPPEPSPRPAPREERGVTRPPSRTYVPVTRRELPESWGPNKSALWADATLREPTLARDEYAQLFYDAALYTRAEEREQAEKNLANFKQYIRDTYGVEWDEIFDWESYREAYDTTIGS
jgi:hypothetical protein